MPTSNLPPSAISARPAPLWAKLTLAVLGPLLLLLSLEGILRAVHFGRETSFFIRDDQPGWLRTNPRFTELFFPASFGLKPLNFRLPKQKPPKSIRIFVVGESAAMGVPEPGFGITPQLQAQLRAAYPEKEIHVYNLGITAIDSHVVRRIVSEAAEYQPDLFVIYMGNNECVGPFGPSAVIAQQTLPAWLIHLRLWLKTTRTGQFIEWIEMLCTPSAKHFEDWRGMERFAGNTVPHHDPRLRRIYANFSANLRNILVTAEKHGAKVVLSTVAVNFKFAPFASEHGHSFSEEQQREWTRLQTRLVETIEFSEWADAEAATRKLKELDSVFAETPFQGAEMLTHMGKRSEAMDQYHQALELDTLRFRADTTINQLIRDISRTNLARIAFVDTAAHLADLAEASPRIDDPLFFEHVHLRWQGNYIVARGLAEAAGRTLFGNIPSSNAWLEPDEVAARVGYTPLGHLAMLQRMDQLTDRPPFSQQSTFARDRRRLALEIAAAEDAIGPRSEIQRAIEQIDKACAIDPENAFLFTSLSTAQTQAGDLSGALASLDRAAALEPFSAELAVRRGFLLRALHRPAEAEKVLRMAAQSEPFYYQTYGLLADVMNDRGETTEAVAYFNTLSAQMPRSSGIRMTYARLLNKIGDLSAAEAQCRAVLAFAPDDETALSAMIKLLNQRHHPDEAIELMLKAYTYNPHNFQNDARLVEAYDQRGATKETVFYMQALEQSGPVNAALHQDLAIRLAKLGNDTEAQIEEHRARSELENEADAEVTSPGLH